MIYRCAKLPQACGLSGLLQMVKHIFFLKIDTFSISTHKTLM